MSDGKIKVICGANDEMLPVVGFRVGIVRDSLVDAFNIPPQALALVNGVQIDCSYIIEANDLLEFCKQSGSKGIIRMLTEKEIRREYTGVPTDVLDDLFKTFSHDDTNPKGELIWMESSVDDWLKDRYSRKRVDDGRDKVIPPSSVRIAGKVYTDLTALEWRLMEVLLSSPDRSVETDNTIEKVYGHDADCKENSLKMVMKRLNKKLEKGPFVVRAENGCVSITR